MKGLNECRNLSCRCPLGAFYAFYNKKGTGLGSEELEANIVKKVQVITTPGRAFGACGEGYLHLSYASLEEVVLEAAKRL